jgi:hypothetical protein
MGLHGLLQRQLYTYRNETACRGPSDAIAAYLRVALEPVDLYRGQHVRQSTETVNQHRQELDDEDDAEKYDEQHTDRFQFQIFLGDGDLKA